MNDFIKNFSSNNALEASEQLRATYTICRQAYASVALLHSLLNKGEEWSKDVVATFEKFNALIIAAHDDFVKIMENKKKEEKK